MSKDEEIQQLRERLARTEGERDVYRDIANRQPVQVAPYYPIWSVLPYVQPYQPWYPWPVTVTYQSSTVANQILSSDLQAYGSNLAVAAAIGGGY